MLSAFKIFFKILVMLGAVFAALAAILYLSDYNNDYIEVYNNDTDDDSF